MRLDPHRADPALLAALGACLPDDGAPLGVAVSGGSDSMAALHLMAAAGYRIEAATVDHGLRPAAAAEAAFVARACAALGVPHAVLRWTGGAGAGNLMDRARRGRYGLLAGWARARGLGHVVVAHTANDLAETFLMRLGHAAGIDGLAAMRPAWDEGGIRFLRPFLGCGREALRGWLAGQGIGWVEDPSNENAAFDRVKARRALAALAPLGIEPGAIARAAGHLAAARDGIDRMLADWASIHLWIDRGDVIVDAEAFAALPDEFGRRLMVAALRLVSGEGYPPRAPALAALIAEGQGTLHGCLVRSAQGEIRITREPAAAERAETVAPGEIWDGRWRLAAPEPEAARGAHVRALGESGLALIGDWRATGLPRASLAAGPSVWSEGHLMAAPLAGMGEGWRAELISGRDGLSQFLQSH